MYRKLIFLVLFTSIVLSCTVKENIIDNKQDTSHTQKPAEVPGTYIVQMEDNQIDRIYDIAKELGQVSVERLFPDGGEWEPRHRKAGLHCWFRISYNPEDEIVTKSLVNLSTIPGVVYAKAEPIIRSNEYYNDPGFKYQWAIYNDGTLGNQYTKDCDINVIPVWDNYTAGSPNVIVAVIDGGVQLDHPDLKDIAIPIGSNGSQSFIDNSSATYIQPDDHGTHVAGVIAAISNNEEGIAGIAGGKDGKGGVKIMSCEILRENPSDPDHTFQGNSYNAFVWAADHGAIIANNSWGNTYKTEAEALNGSVGPLGPAIDYFINYARCDKEGNQKPDSPMKGGIVIFAAGNEEYKMSWPAAYEPVIAVGAVSANGTKSYYSNYGDWVDICAPGGDAKQGPLIYSSVSGSKYDYMQGTSMACPQVSGVAALIASYFGGPGFTNEMLKERLLKGANKSKIQAYSSIGPMVDALGSFSYGSTTPPDAVTDYTIEAHSNQIQAAWKVTADSDDGKAYGYIVAATKNPDDYKEFDPKNIPSSVNYVIKNTDTNKIGETLQANISKLSFESKYYIAIIAFDYNQNYSSISQIKEVVTEKNQVPVISTDYNGDWIIMPFETIRANFSISDPDGHAFTYKVDPGSNAFIFQEIIGGYQAVLTGNAAPAGQYTATILVTDEYGAITEKKIEYIILSNHAPVAVDNIENILFTSIGETVKLDMEKYVVDEDGESLSFMAETSNKQIVHISPELSTIYITALNVGSTNISITGTDALGESVTLSFKALVRNSSSDCIAYPNPVENTLYISNTEVEPINVDVRILSSTGGFVYSGTVLCGAFDPANIDMSKCAPGVYSVTVSYNGNTYKQTVIKK